MSGEFSSDEIGEIVTMILGTVHPVFVGNFNPVLTRANSPPACRYSYERFPNSYSDAKRGGIPLGYMQSAVTEHQFWLQVLGDHARFILTALSPVETAEIKRATELVNVLDDLLTRSRQSLAVDELQSLNEQAYRYAKKIRTFKLHLLKRHLVNHLQCGLSPTFFNHMVNENEEYLRILKHLRAGETPPPLHPIHHHLLWLFDAAAHASIINGEVDPVEKTIKKKSKEFTKTFEGFYLKSVELAGYLRTNLDKFPALRRFNHDIELEMQLFTNFLNELEEMEIGVELLSTLTPLIPDHMAREECYYLHKLAEVSEVKSPNCDPAKPRVE
jgi:hypothetical protein